MLGEQGGSLVKPTRNKSLSLILPSLIIVCFSDAFAAGGKMVVKSQLTEEKLSELVTEILRYPRKKEAVIKQFGTPSGKLTDYQINVTPRFSNVKSVKTIFDGQVTLINMEGVSEITLNGLKRYFGEVVDAPSSIGVPRSVIMTRKNSKDECRVVVYLSDSSSRKDDKIKSIDIRCEKI